MAISERQMYRLVAKYEDGGGSALIHKARGRQSNRSLNAGIRRYAVELVRTRYADSDRHSQQKFYSKSTVCALGERPCAGGWLPRGLWLSRKQRRTFQPRLRREHYGELIQIERQRAPLVRGPKRAVHATGSSSTMLREG